MNSNYQWSEPVTGKSHRRIKTTAEILICLFVATLVVAIMVVSVIYWPAQYDSYIVEPTTPESLNLTIETLPPTCHRRKCRIQRPTQGQKDLLTSQCVEWLFILVTLNRVKVLVYKDGFESIGLFYLLLSLHAGFFATDFCDYNNSRGPRQLDNSSPNAAIQQYKFTNSSYEFNENAEYNDQLKDKAIL